MTLAPERDRPAAGHARVNVGFAVQAHPQRSLDAIALADQIGGRVSWDPGPFTLRSPWRSFRHLMDTAPEGVTHQLQIQDDATVCPGFTEAVTRAVEAQPHRVLVFYVGTQMTTHTEAVFEACRRNFPWAKLRLGSWIPVVSTCWPRPLFEGLVDWYDQESREWPASYVADDEIVGKYLNHIGHTALASVPSLVDHLDAVPSIMGKRGRAEQGRARRAACWVGDCADCVGEIDWTRGPLTG